MFVAEENDSCFLKVRCRAKKPTLSLKKETGTANNTEYKDWSTKQGG